VLQAELRYKRDAGLLIDVAEVAAEHAGQILRARNKLLAIPNRLTMRFPDASAAIARYVDQSVRETLDELADGATE
jgi:hypothetical protein